MTTFYPNYIVGIFKFPAVSCLISLLTIYPTNESQHLGSKWVNLAKPRSSETVISNYLRVPHLVPKEIATVGSLVPDTQKGYTLYVRNFEMERASSSKPTKISVDKKALDSLLLKPEGLSFSSTHVLRKLLFELQS